jgi:chemotaxis protein MotB
MSDENQPIIIIKKIKKSKKDSHGGSWKIAYADFVTAMMAFFMLLWLLSLLNKYQLQGVSAYFQKPLSDIFVGSKNAEHYKRPNKEKIIKNNKSISASANVDTTKNKLRNSAATSSTQTKADQNTKKEDTSIKAKEDNASKVNDDKNKSKEEKNKNDATAEMLKIKKQLEISLQNNSALKQFKDNLSFEIVDDGVKVSLHDSKNNPMFPLGKADFENYAKPVINWLSGEFNKIPKQIVIIGHTDAYQYDTFAPYTNWELSTDRANAVRRLLIGSGMKPNKIIRVQGAADVSLEDEKNGDNPVNRRVEVIILTPEAAKRMIKQ